MSQTRRDFLQCGTLALGALAMSAAGAPSIQTGPRNYRAAVIGRTGGGDYGHGYERIFSGMENVSVEAIADHDAAGLEKGAKSSGARRQYRDFREMLRKEKPDLVSIAPRQPDCHKEMALAAIEVGAHLFIEKPFTETVSDADEILAAAEKKGVKIVVAHNRRWTAGFLKMGEMVRRGMIGAVREVHIHGKQDTRAGGEDMIVLGTHDFDLMRLYFGDPAWCFATVSEQGREVTRESARKGSEPILVAGDTIHAMFGFPGGLAIQWSSVKAKDDWNTRRMKRERWSFEIHGTTGIIAYQSGLEFAWLESPFLAHPVDPPRWRSLPELPDWKPAPHSMHPIRSLIHAVETGGQPVCSGYDGRWAVEMVSAVYQSHLGSARVRFPLANRQNPLARA